MLAAFLMLGRYLEGRAKGRTSEAIKKLAGLRVKTAILIRDGQEMEVSVEDVVVGDQVIVKPGAKVPVDGEVVAGESYVNEAMITGEPVPPLKTVGSRVVGGTPEHEQRSHRQSNKSWQGNNACTDHSDGRGCTGFKTAGPADR